MKLMKTVAALMAVLMLTCACSKKNDGVGGDYKLATGSETGTYFAFGTTLAALWEKRVPGVTAAALVTGGSKENLRLVSAGAADLALTQSDILWYAQNGEELFKGERQSGITAISSLYKEYVQVVVPANSEVNSISELITKRVAVGASGSATEASARQVLAAAGLSYDDITVKYQSFSDSVSALKSGTLDAAFVVSGIPGAVVENLAAQIQIRLLPINGEVSSALRAAYPFYVSAKAPAGSYGAEEEVETVAITVMLVCRSTLSADEVYALTAAAYNNLAELGAANAKGLEVSLAGAGTGVVGARHEGAERYFAEKNA